MNKSEPISLVLLPGLDGTGVLFQPLVKKLPPSIKPIVVRYPTDRHLTYDQLLPIVQNALPQSGRFLILGESFSGPLAVMAAARRPKGLTGIVFGASFITNPHPIVGAALSVLAQPFLLQFFPRFSELTDRISGCADREYLARKCRSLSSIRAGVLAARVRMILGVDVTDDFRSCRVPALYIAGSRDYIVPRWNLHTILKIKPDIQCVTFSSAHMVLQTRPEQSVKAIAQFAAMASFAV